MTDLGQRLIAAVRKHAADKPDYVYERDDCVYVHDGQPSCLIGYALWDEEVITPNLNGFLNGKLISDDPTFGPGLASHLGLELDFYESKWLKDVQRNQDNGIRWGEAVARADRYRELLP